MCKTRLLLSQAAIIRNYCSTVNSWCSRWFLFSAMFKKLLKMHFLTQHFPPQTSNDDPRTTIQGHPTTEIAVFWAHGESGQPVLHGWNSGKKRRGRPRRRWTDNIRDWMGSSVAECTRMAQERELWRTMVSLSQVIDLQQWRWSSPVQSSPFSTFPPTSF